MNKVKTVILNLLFDLGLVSKAEVTESSYGEFDQEKTHRYIKLAALAVFIGIIIHAFKKK